MSNFDLKNSSPAEIDHEYLKRLCTQARSGWNLEHAINNLLRLSTRSVHVAIRCADGRRKGIACVNVREDAPIAPAEAWGIIDHVTIEEVQQYTPTPEECVSEGLGTDKAREEYATRLEEHEKAKSDVQEIEAHYSKAPWSRYWLVTSSDGHIHRSRCCHTCNKGRSATAFALAASLSGSDDKDAVAALGPALCSACFPEAPVDSREQFRIKARLAKILERDGIEEFHAEVAKAKQKALKNQAEKCSRSGTFLDVSPSPHGYYGYHRCPECGWSGKLTSTGKIRPHKRQASKV
jgi:hypothetical protein